MCSNLPPRLAADTASRSLHLHGELEFKLEPMVQAHDYLIQVLSLRLKNFGAADNMAANIARRLRLIENKMSTMASYGASEDVKTQQLAERFL